MPEEYCLRAGRLKPRQPSLVLDTIFRAAEKIMALFVRLS
jgi:hypothetical protein